MIPAISQVCCLSSSFQNDLEQFGAAGCRAVEIWLTKLEDYVREHSAEQAKALLQEHQLRPVAASYQGGMLGSQGAPRAAAWELFDKRLQLCRDVGIDLVVLACDVNEPLSETLLDRVRTSLVQAAEAAASSNVRLALEFQGRATLGNNLQTAAMLVQEAGQRNLGLCLDVFHFFCGPSKFPDLGYLTLDNLFHVQLCDTLGARARWRAIRSGSCPATANGRCNPSSTACGKSATPAPCPSK